MSLTRALLLSAGLLPAGQLLAAETYAFAPLPMEQPETVVRQVRPMLAYLERKLGSGFRIEYSEDYDDVLSKFREGKVDLVYLGPLPYVALREGFAQAVPVVHFLEKSGKPTYTCAIVVAGEKVSLSSLKGKKIALTQPLSTCGYLATDGLLRQAGLSLEQTRYRYLDKHDEVALAVTRGEFDAGGLKTTIARKYGHMGLSVVAETQSLPSFALIANGRTMRPEAIEAIRRSLVALQPLKEAGDAEITRLWGESIRNGAVAASDADYDAVRRLRAQADIPEDGNF
jgi:phosphonate transport system substrate-binding protein